MFLVSVRIVRYNMLALVFERASLMRESFDLMASAIDSNMVLQSRNLLKSQQYFLKHRTGPQKWIK